jgi:RNA polymerase sigma factor (sigma-70 family)
MDKNDWLAKSFEESRKRLKSVALKILGSESEAEDAVQEAYIRLNKSTSEQIENLAGWLTTVVARICLDELRSRKMKREVPLELEHDKSEVIGPEVDLLVADSIGPALLVILDTLTPIERTAFVLHDVFEVPFEEIAKVIDRTEVATRQLTSRARRRIKGQPIQTEDPDRQREVVAAFLAASREGNFSALMDLLHPDIVLRADDAAIKITSAKKDMGVPQYEREIRDAKHIANLFNGGAAAARMALINGELGSSFAMQGKAMVTFSFVVEHGKITAIDVVMDRKQLNASEIYFIEQEGSH